ncbi:BapA prefix-like domain-containing protein, partial [Acinetobacter bouvetii]
MANIQVVSKQSHKVLDKTLDNKVLLTENSVVKINVDKELVESITRDGNSAVVKLKNGETIVIENFFNGSIDANSIVLEGKDGLYWVQFTDAAGNVTPSIVYNPLNEITPLLYDETASSIQPWLIGAGVVGGAAAIAANSSSSSGDDGDNRDRTPPESPKKLLISNDGTKVTGKAEPGSKIEVKDANGNVIGSGTADANGNFEVAVSPAQKNGETLQVTATDAAGNASAPAPVTADDTTAPAAPTNLDVSDDGSKVTGKAEPGSKVEVKDGNGNVIGSGTADANGNFEVAVSPAQKNGETLQVTATDAAGNASAPAPATADDTTAPAAPEATVSPDGKSVLGRTEPNAAVEVKDTNGNVIGSGTADANGNFEVAVNPAIDNGAKATVTATDAAGNKSAATQVTGGLDTLAPAAPT